MKTVVFQGYSGNGKTRAVVGLVGELTKAGMKVGTVKSIHDDVLTLDAEGKASNTTHTGDSFRMALRPR